MRTFKTTHGAEELHAVHGDESEGQLAEHRHTRGAYHVQDATLPAVVAAASGHTLWTTEQHPAAVRTRERHQNSAAPEHRPRVTIRRCWDIRAGGRRCGLKLPEAQDTCLTDSYLAEQFIGDPSRTSLDKKI